MVELGRYTLQAEIGISKLHVSRLSSVRTIHYLLGFVSAFKVRLVGCLSI